MMDETSGVRRLASSAMGHIFILQVLLLAKSKKKKKTSYSLPLLKSSEKSLRLAEGNSDCSRLKLPLIIDSPVNNNKKKNSSLSSFVGSRNQSRIFFCCFFFLQRPSGRSLLRLPWLQYETTPRGFFFFLNVNLLHTQAIIHCGSKPGPRCVFSLFSIIESPQKEPVENCILFSLEGNFVRS